MKLLKTLVLLPSFVVLTFSCNKKLEDNKIKDVLKDSQTVNATDMVIEQIPEMCYFDDIKNDSVYLKVVDNLGTITGKLRYKNFEKDSSTGDIMGFMSGDTLKLDYMYSSEGITSTREIWFLKKNGKLLEGIGTQDADGNYTNAKDVKFENGHTMEPIDCDKIAKNLK